MCYLYSVSKELWYKPGFRQLKGDARKQFILVQQGKPSLPHNTQSWELVTNKNSRLIRPAQDSLAFAQAVLNEWIKRSFPSRYDYLYRGDDTQGMFPFVTQTGIYPHGGGTLAAVRKHLYKGRKRDFFALKGDFLEAYSYVSTHILQTILNSNCQRLGMSLSNEQIGIIVDLLTYDGSLPIGAITSPRSFSLVADQIHHCIDQIARKHRAVYTPYLDDFLMSAGHPINLQQMRDEVATCVEGYGFRLNHEKTVMSNGEPVMFLGVMIDGKKMWLPPEKLNEYLIFVTAAAKNSKELNGTLRAEVQSRWAWVYGVYAQEVPDFLLEAFVAYYRASKFPVPRTLGSVLRSRSVQ